MPRVFNQKIKILYLMRIFLEQTDEEHPMSVKELIAYLIVWGSVQSVRLSMMILKPCGILEWIS